MKHLCIVAFIFCLNMYGNSKNVGVGEVFLIDFELGSTHLLKPSFDPDMLELLTPMSGELASPWLFRAIKPGRSTISFQGSKTQFRIDREANVKVYSCDDVTVDFTIACHSPLLVEKSIFMMYHYGKQKFFPL